jgi:hypothetical protein
MNTPTVLALAFAIGVVAGLRSLTAPMVVSWAARLSWLDLQNTWAAFLGYAATPYLFIAPSKAWERRRRCNGYTSKPFVGIRWVTNPTRQSVASSRKRVLRRGSVRARRSVDSQCQGRAIEPREYYPLEPSSLTERGQHRHTVTARRVRSGRGRRTRRRHNRIPQELGTPCALRDARPDREPDDQTLVC